MRLVRRVRVGIKSLAGMTSGVVRVVPDFIQSLGSQTVFATAVVPHDRRRRRPRAIAAYGRRRGRRLMPIRRRIGGGKMVARAWSTIHEGGRVGEGWFVGGSVGVFPSCSCRSSSHQVSSENRGGSRTRRFGFDIVQFAVQSGRRSWMGFRRRRGQARPLFFHPRRRAGWLRRNHRVVSRSASIVGTPVRMESRRRRRLFHHHIAFPT